MIVVGLGATGCSATYHLAKTDHKVMDFFYFPAFARWDLKVLGIEKASGIRRYRLPHTAFTFHCPIHYHAILQRSINLWQRLEDASGMVMRGRSESFDSNGVGDCDSNRQSVLWRKL